MVRKSALFLVLALIAPVASGAEFDIWIQDKGGEIPTTLTVPDEPQDTAFPLVVLLHGHGGTRDENGGFTELAAMLAENGIASVRMDFPGCGDSKIEFVHNAIPSMLHDINYVMRYVIDIADIDTSRVGVLGYSMGGRLATMLAGSQIAMHERDYYSTVALWAPAGMKGPEAMYRFFGGRNAYETYRNAALKNGSVLFVTPWGQEQELGELWFTNLESYPHRGMADFTGSLLILHGAEDEIIAPRFGQAIAGAATSSAELTFDVIPNAGHGLGFYSDNPNVRSYVLETTVDFFRRNLLKNN